MKKSKKKGTGAMRKIDRVRFKIENQATHHRLMEKGAVEQGDHESAARLSAKASAYEKSLAIIDSVMKG